MAKLFPEHLSRTPNGLDTQSNTAEENSYLPGCQQVFLLEQIFLLSS